jgi:hypothetical protein
MEITHRFELTHQSRFTTFAMLKFQLVTQRGMTHLTTVLRGLSLFDARHQIRQNKCIDLLLKDKTKDLPFSLMKNKFVRSYKPNPPTPKTIAHSHSKTILSAVTSARLRKVTSFLSS